MSSNKNKRESLSYTGMSTNQIERLRKDSRELGHYIKRLEKKSKYDKIHIMRTKQQLIDDSIDELEFKYLLTA
jgi:hypothetical protein